MVEYVFSVVAAIDIVLTHSTQNSSSLAEVVSLELSSLCNSAVDESLQLTVVCYDLPQLVKWHVERLYSHPDFGSVKLPLLTDYFISVFSHNPVNGSS